MVFKMCEGVLCSSFSVKELDVIVHKKYFPCITLLNFGHPVPHLTSESGEGILCSSFSVKELDVIVLGILYPTSLANLVVEVWTRHCHQILLESYLMKDKDLFILPCQYKAQIGMIHSLS